MSMWHLCVFWDQKRGCQTSETGGTEDGHEQPCGYWDLNLGPPEEQASVLNSWALSPAPAFELLLWNVCTLVGSDNN